METATFWERLAARTQPIGILATIENPMTLVKLGNAVRLNSIASALLLAGLLFWFDEPKAGWVALAYSGAYVVASVVYLTTGRIAWETAVIFPAISGFEGIVRLLEVESGAEVLSLVGHDAILFSVGFNPTGDRLAAAGLDSESIVWDITPAGSREVATFTTPYSALLWERGVRYTTGGGSVLVTSEEGANSGVARLDAATGEVLATMPSQFSQFPVTPLLAPEAGLVASVTSDLKAALHDAETFTPVVSLPEGRYAVAVSRDGSIVVLDGIDSAPPEVVEVGSWNTLMSLEGPLCWADFSPR